MISTFIVGFLTFYAGKVRLYADIAALIVFLRANNK